MHQNRSFTFLLIGAVFSCIATYLILPTLPIYFVEPIRLGGLGMAKSEALSLYGNFLAFHYSSTFIAGYLTDIFIGKKRAIAVGFALALIALFCLISQKTTVILPFLMLLSLGMGFIKVTLASNVANCSQKSDRYDSYYNALNIGYIFATLMSGIFFQRMGIKYIFIISLLAMSCGAVFAKMAIKNVFVTVEKEKKRIACQPNIVLFSTLLLLGMLFFILSNQASTSVILFLHQI